MLSAGTCEGLLLARVELPTGYGGDGLGVPSRVGPLESGGVNKGLWVELGDAAEEFESGNGAEEGPMGEVGMPPPDTVAPVIIVIETVWPGSSVLFERGYGVAREVPGAAVDGGISAVALNGVSAELTEFVVTLREREGIPWLPLAVMDDASVPVPPAIVELPMGKGGGDISVDRDVAVSELPTAVSVLFGRGKGAVGETESGSEPDVKLGTPVPELVIGPAGPLPSVELLRENVKELLGIGDGDPDVLTVENGGDSERLTPEKGAPVPV